MTTGVAGTEGTSRCDSHADCTVGRRARRRPCGHGGSVTPSPSSQTRNSQSYPCHPWLLTLMNTFSLRNPKTEPSHNSPRRTFQAAPDSGTPENKEHGLPPSAPADGPLRRRENPSSSLLVQPVPGRTTDGRLRAGQRRGWTTRPGLQRRITGSAERRTRPRQTAASESAEHNRPSLPASGPRPLTPDIRPPTLRGTCGLFPQVSGQTSGFSI